MNFYGSEFSKEKIIKKLWWWTGVVREGYKEKDGGCEIKSIRPIAWSSTKSGFGRGRVLAVVS